MRTTVGILLIIMSLINFGGGLIWTVAGIGFSGLFDSMIEDVSQRPETTQADKDRMKEAQEKIEQARDSFNKPELVLYCGLGELLLALMELVAGIMCLMKKGAMFITITGIFEVLLSGLSLYAVGTGRYVWVIGIIVGILAILGASSVRSESASKPDGMAGFGGA